MISVVVLTKNEEKNIEECLKTLAWVEEVIVIDDNSEDKTPEIAEKLGAKVIKHPLENDFSAQRNFGLEQIRQAHCKQATGEWILFVDADERVSPEVAEEVKKAIAESKNVDGFYLKRKDHLFGQVLKHGETASVLLLRLAKKGMGKWEGKVHETWKITGEVGELENPLEHYPHQTISAFLEEINDYSTLRAQELYEQNTRTNLGQIIGYPLAKFGQNYVLRLGFLDGMPGLVMAILMSFHSFLVRSKLYLLWQQQGGWQ